MRRQVGPTDGRMSLPPPHPPSGGPRRSRICQRFFQRHQPVIDEGTEEENPVFNRDMDLAGSRFRLASHLDFGFFVTGAATF